MSASTMHVDLILEVESVLILVSAECRAQKMRVEECNQAYAGLVHRIRHKADRLVTRALKLLLLAICLCFIPQSVCEESGIHL